MTSRDDLLAALARRTDGKLWQPLHGCARLAYRGPLRALCQRLLARSTGERGLRLVARHSVTHGEGFNVFASDLDLTVVLEAPFDLQHTDRVLAAYHRLKTRFPALGEIEIFSAGEWDELSALWASHGALLRLLRDLKKMRWMEAALGGRTHPYHREKCRRASQRVVATYWGALVPLAEIGDRGNHELLGAGFARRFEGIFPVAAVARALAHSEQSSLQVFSSEIDGEICSTDVAPEKRAGALCLPFAAAACLLAVQPSHYDEHPETAKLLAPLRDLPEVRQARDAVLRYELLYANASPRVHIRHRANSPRWTERLLAQLGEHHELPGLLNRHLETPANQDPHAPA